MRKSRVVIILAVFMFVGCGLGDSGSELFARAGKRHARAVKHKKKSAADYSGIYTKNDKDGESLDMEIKRLSGNDYYYTIVTLQTEMHTCTVEGEATIKGNKLVNSYEGMKCDEGECREVKCRFTAVFKGKSAKVENTCPDSCSGLDQVTGTYYK
jgi:hypothetical protein